MSGHVWSYVAETMLGTSENRGPIPEGELMALAKAGKLKRDTLVSSPTRTKDGWHSLSQIPAFLRMLEEGEQQRKAEKEQQAAARIAEQQAKRAASQADQHAHAAQAQQAAAAVAQISDCSDVGMVNTIQQRVSSLLTTAERIQYIAVQKKPLVNIAPDAMVATTRRLIFYRPKLLGRYDFQDYPWLDLANAHITQNMLGAVFTAQHVSGQVLSMDYLPQVAAQTLYRLAQEWEEQARIERRNMQLEAARATASQINIGNPFGQSPPQAAASAAPSGGDLMQRLQTLKSMADGGLITPEEFAARKAEILQQV